MDGEGCMRSICYRSARNLAASIVATALLGSILLAQGKDPNKDQPKQDSNASTRLRIEITGGEKSAPVDMASVYIRFVTKKVLAKDQNSEMNIKTNKEGVAIANGIPRGKVLVQVVADGWKSFGQWYDTNEDEQTIKIHLEKPPKWF
jgi:hypothetical protein